MDQNQLRLLFCQNINDGLQQKEIPADQTLAKNRFTGFSDEDYAEYEPVIGNKVRDMNKERNFQIEAVKKNWNQRKASAYKIRDQHPVQRYASLLELSPMGDQHHFLVADPADFEMPIITRTTKAVTSFKGVRKLRRAKKQLRKQRNENKSLETILAPKLEENQIPQLAEDNNEMDQSNIEPNQ